MYYYNRRIALIINNKTLIKWIKAFLISKFVYKQLINLLSMFLSLLCIVTFNLFCISNCYCWYIHIPHFNFFEFLNITRIFFCIISQTFNTLAVDASVVLLASDSSPLWLKLEALEVVEDWPPVAERLSPVRSSWSSFSWKYTDYISHFNCGVLCILNMMNIYRRIYKWQD